MIFILTEVDYRELLLKTDSVQSGITKHLCNCAKINSLPSKFMPIFLLCVQEKKKKESAN